MRRAIAALLCLCVIPPSTARAQATDIGASLREITRRLESLSRTGVLYERVLPLARLERLDGSSAAPAIDLARWRQAYDELRRASLGPSPWPDRVALDAAARASLRDGVIPIAIIDRGFERVPAEAMKDGRLRLLDGVVTPSPGFALERTRAVAAAALAPRTYRGGDVVFSIDPDRWFSDAGAPPRTVAIDFADGLGPRPVALGARTHVHYPTTGVHTLRAEFTRADGSEAEARFAFDVAALATPTPSDTLHITASVAWQGQFGTADAYVDLAPGHTTLTNPVVVIEGFDLDNSMNWDELYALLNQQNLLETLRADGYDAVVLNFTDATVAVEQNGYVVSELIQRVESLIPPQNTIALVGASMGGLCSRYALAWLETQGIAHRVRTWISFDAPHGGADIPLGLQYWISFFSGQSTDAAAFLAILQRPAAREMLIHHLTSPPGTTGQPDPLRASMLASFAAVGDYPRFTRRTAVANGSDARANQGFLPGDQLIRWEYSSLFVAITGDVWAVPDQTSNTIFRGSTRILFSTTSQTTNVSATAPWDGAPGGSRASLAELDAIAAPYGDIVALHPSHCFVPTVSALALNSGDPFFDVAGQPNLLALTPFDAIYHQAANQEHVTVTPENAAWIRNEIEQSQAAVGVPDTPAPIALALASEPNPFSANVRVTFSLPRAARATVRAFDVRGREVRTLVDGVQSAGPHAITWDGRDAAGRSPAPGVYFLRLDADGQTRVRRVVRLS
jgi:triacylglycerol esterase/lipase EstA (alpha/beta hydrolase family)